MSPPSRLSFSHPPNAIYWRATAPACHHAGRDEERRPMRLSARNILAGTVTEVKKRTTAAHVRIDIGGGNVITASITNEAVDDLKLKKGDRASAIIKASEIIVGKD
jgi:molybdopterin-binding protein